MVRRLILVRHGEVATRWHNVCYGWSDAELSQRGMMQSLALGEQFASLPIETVWHSGMRRTRVVAEEIAVRTGAQCLVEPALRERSFGAWENRTWDGIYAETGSAMEGMILAPDTFCPPGGETTAQLRDRVLAWHRSLPSSGCFVAVTHGGPIAALVGTLRGAPLTAWPRLIPAFGAYVELVGEISSCASDS